jgi:hypothetical protein
MTQLNDAISDLAAMPLGEMPLHTILSMLDTCTASVERLAPAVDTTGRRLHDEVFIDGRVIEQLAAARNDIAGMHAALADGAQMAHTLYDAYVLAAAEGGSAPNRDNLIATQNG